MATTSYITPIMDRTNEDVEYARTHQNDLVHKHKGAFNYTDMNRICNNLKYAAEYMYDQGFLSQPYQMQIKTNWKESDIVTYNQINSMIVVHMNNLKTYARGDLEWNYIPSIANVDYVLLNRLEYNIHQLATQDPIPPDKYSLTVMNGSGSGNYEARTIIDIRANTPDEGYTFSHWSGNHLENIGDSAASSTTYTMPNEDVTLIANYIHAVLHTFTINTFKGTQTGSLWPGEIKYIEADPAPQGKVFHHWTVEPSKYEENLYEPAASTHFTMPNENITLTAVYITKGQKHLIVRNGTGTGYYDYDSYVSIKSNKQEGATFTNWTGDVQYLTGDSSQEYNSVRIPDVNEITLNAHWTYPTPPLVTDVPITIVNGVISSTGQTTGKFTEKDSIAITANPAPEGYTFDNWSYVGGGSLGSRYMPTALFTVGSTESTLTANYRLLKYHNLTVTTNSGTTTTIKEELETFTVDARPIPEGYVFDKWTGDVSGLNVSAVSTTTHMGGRDRTITAVYRLKTSHTLTVEQLSGDQIYTNLETTSISITAEDAPTGKKFSGWNLSGYGSISSYHDKTITYTYGNGDAVLTPSYTIIPNKWTITVTDGTINGTSSAVLSEGSTYSLYTRSLQVYEKFDGWTKTGPGTISNTASTSTRFTVGNGDATIKANISQYPDKTLTIYWRHPDTGVDTLISSTTYTYGTRIDNIEAEPAINQTTFATWLGDTSILYPSALASTVRINSLTADTTIIATYYYPESPEYYTLTVYNGYPQERNYAVGSQIEITANTPAQGYEFYKWYGDTQFIVNQQGLSSPTNSVIMPQQAVTLYAKFKVIGELPLFRVNVSNGIANATYVTGEGTDQEIVHNESGAYIDIPAGTEVTLTADADVVGYVFDYWAGNFTEAGVNDIITTNNPTKFTMVENDLNIQMIRRELDKYTVYTTNATGGGEYYAGTYPIAGNKVDTENEHYIFTRWSCEDADHNNCISAITDPSNISTTVTLTDKDLWVNANYTTYYKLTVIHGQNTGGNYYYDGEVVNTVYADEAPTGMQFDHWEDPVGIITSSIYDPTPSITMKNSIATITAVFTSLDAAGNSIISTSNDLHTEIIRRRNSVLINGNFSIGTIAFDKDGCIGVITEVDPDHNDDTDDYRVQKLFYGGNF